MLGDRKRDVFQHGPDKIAVHHRALAERATVHDRAAKVGEAAVGNDNKVGEKRDLVVRAVPARAHPKHATRERAFDQVRHRHLEDVDARRGPGARAEVLDEAAMVKGAALGAGGVRYVDGLSSVQNGVAVYGYCIDAVEARAEA
jgi:hypothetical protein